GEIAAVGFPGRSMVKNIDRIVRRPTAGRRSPTDQTGKAEASRIDTIFFKIIAAPLFAGRFTDAINRGRIMCGVLGTIDPRGTWAKDRNAAGPEDGRRPPPGRRQSACEVRGRVRCRSGRGPRSRGSILFSLGNRSLRKCA